MWARRDSIVNGMVNVDLYSAIITKVPDVLNTLVSGQNILRQSYDNAKVTIAPPPRNLTGEFGNPPTSYMAAAVFMP